MPVVRIPHEHDSQCAECGGALCDCRVCELYRESGSGGYNEVRSLLYRVHGAIASGLGDCVAAQRAASGFGGGSGGLLSRGTSPHDCGAAAHAWLASNGYTLEADRLDRADSWAHLLSAHYDWNEDDETEYDDDPPYRDDDYGRARIFDYSYSPTPLMFRDGMGAASPFPTDRTPYLGIELELEFPRRDYGELGEVADFVNGEDSAMSSYWYAKHDGSLDNGAEIVSHPGVIDAHRSEYPWAKLLRGLRGMGAVADDSCGIHVHATRSALANWQWARIAHVLWSSRGRVERFAGRQSTWGKLDLDMREQTLNVLTKKDRPHERYAAMNLLPRETVEFRLFASTTSEDMALGALECVAALVDYAKALPTADAMNGALTWSAFCSWARPLFPAFAARLIATR